MQQLALHLGPVPAPSFDNYLAGSNAQALRALTEGPRPGVPIYLWGPAGVGKSHLLHAQASAVAARGQPVARFEARLATPWRPAEDGALVILDACEAFDAERQHAAFALFVQAADAGLPVLAAGRLPPVDLPVREDLRTRLGWGLVIQLHPLADHEARDALVHESQRRGVPLSDEVLDFLLTRFERDLGSLMRWLDALDIYSLREQRAITVPLIKRLLHERGVLAAPEAAA